jgi:hypothetical protein
MAFSPSGDPRSKSTSLESAFFVSSKIPIGPLLLSDFVTVEPLTDEQSSNLEKMLGVPLTKAAREEINSAVHRMAVTIALAARIPGWGAFRERLNAILESGQICKNAAEQFVQIISPGSLGKEKPQGALSVYQAVETYLSLAGIKDSIVQVNIESILNTCKQALKEIEPRASRRQPTNIGLANFLRTIDVISENSGVKPSLPPDRVRERNEPRLTRHFQFGRECLKITITKGRASVATAPLTDEEQLHAENIFSQLDKYVADDRQSVGAFLSRWRKARGALEAPETAN